MTSSTASPSESESTSENFPFLVVVGPCVIESQELVFEIASSLQKQLKGLPIQWYLKASFDKANRTSLSSFRGPGLKKGLKILKEVKDKFHIPVLTDFHTPDQAMPVAEVVDVVQVPAFLVRQTDMILKAVEACVRYQRVLNLKKAQFLAPLDMKHVIHKVKESADSFHETRPLSKWCWLTERGTCFGYHHLMVDMGSFSVLKTLGARVIYDATHSIQILGTGGKDNQSGGEREKLEPLAYAAMAAGAEGVFLECHPEPSRAKSDGANALSLECVGVFIKNLLKIFQVRQSLKGIEETNKKNSR